MGFKEKMADRMMGNMSAEEKQAMMASMMEKFMADMTPEDRQKMMDSMMERFTGSMSPEEKQGMMKNMMPKMMSGGMMGMMGAMMGGHGDKHKDGSGGSPMDMCKQMMSSMMKTSELAAFATPELRGLFHEWMTQIEEEILASAAANDGIDAAALSEQFKLSVESVNYVLGRLASKGKIKLRAEKGE